MFDIRCTAALLGRPDEALLSQEDIGAMPNSMIEAGLLVKADRNAVAGHGDSTYGFVKCPCGEGHWERIERDVAGGKTCWYVCCQHSTRFYELEPDQLQLWKISIAGIIRIIREGFACATAPVMMAPGLWRLGDSGRAVAGMRRQVFFAERMSTNVEAALPGKQTASILVIGELNPKIPDMFGERAFLLHEIVQLDGGSATVDLELIASRLGPLPKEEKAKPGKKNKDVLIRRGRLKKLLEEHLQASRDHYWHTESDGEICGKILPRPTLGHLVGQLEKRYGDKIDTSNVNRAITHDQHLSILWKACKTTEQAKNYRRGTKSLLDGGVSDVAAEEENEVEAMFSGFANGE